MIEIHSKLSGRYIITKPIGSGGMANVYLARDLILDRDVAVKVLKYDFQDDQEAIQRFQREAIAASQLLHHNIVEVYDVDEEQGQQYIVMEYVKGTDLKNFIRERSPLSLELAVNIMSQILSGIEVAHKHGIIHRDIKPQNILITDDNEVKITDFGIAIALSDTSLTQTNTLLGSVHYLSPEQARGSSATIKSDIYAIGAVLYELITGEVPFDGESAVSIALKHFQEDFPRIRDKMDYVPQSLENVILRATAKDPAKRYNSVHEMLMDLSTSLSVIRMNESPFDPDRNLADPESLVITPIRPVRDAEMALNQAEKEKEVVPEEESIVNYDEIPEPKPPKFRRWMIRFASVVLALVVLFGLYTVVSSQLGSTTVPNLAELSLEEAKDKLAKENLMLGEVKQDWDHEIPSGYVIGTDPKAKTSVKKNTAIDLIVSSGREQVELGDYIGQNYEQVRQKLIQAGFIVERHDLYTNNQEEADVILAQSIQAGSRVVPEATSITLTVGSYSQSSVMQEFYNLSLKMVENFADNYGLNVEVDYQYHDFIPKDQVIRQSPNSGTPLQPGDTISVVVSLGQEETEIVPVRIPISIEYVPRYSESDLNQSHPLANVIEVFIGDSKNNINQVAEKFEIKESKEIQITLYIPSNGVGQYRIMRDGDVVDESPEVYPQTPSE